MQDLLATLPWKLIATALVLCAALALLVFVERKRDKKDRRVVAKAEANLGTVIHFAQKKHQEKFGRPSTDLAELEASLPPLKPTMKQGA